MDAPNLIEYTADEVLAYNLDIFKQIAGKTIKPGQPEYDEIIAPMSYCIFLWIQRVNSAIKKMLPQFSSGIWLDYLAAIVGVTRTPAGQAVCTLKFNLVSGHGSIVLSAGLRVASTDGKAIFATNEDVTVAAEINEISVSATCQTAGIVGNGYEIGDITNILDPYAFVSACTNTDATTGGSDTETDEQLSARMLLAPSAFSSLATIKGVEYFTYAYSSLIQDVKVLTATEDPSISPGLVNVYVLLVDAVTPTSSFLTGLQNYLSLPERRMINDTLQAFANQTAEYELTISAVRLTSSAKTAAQLTSSLNTLIQSFNETKTSKLGLDIIATEIEAICRIEGIYDATAVISTANSGRNLIVPQNAIGVMTDYSITITGQNIG